MRKGRNDYHANEVVTSLLFRDLWDEWFSGRTLEGAGSPCLTREKVQLQRRQLQRGQGSGPKIRSLQPALPVPFLDCFRPGWLTQLRQQNVPEAVADGIQTSLLSSLFFSPILYPAPFPFHYLCQLMPQVSEQPLAMASPVTGSQQ